MRMNKIPDKLITAVKDYAIKKYFSKVEDIESLTSSGIFSEERFLDIIGYAFNLIVGQDTPI